MKFSVFVVTFNRHPKLLLECLNSLLRELGDEKNCEVIVVLNGDPSNIERYKKEFPKFLIYHIYQATQAKARNTAVHLADPSSEVFYFLDDRCTVTPGYFNRMNIANIAHYFDLLSGPINFHHRMRPFDLIVGAALASPLCMGPAYRRHTQNSPYKLSVSTDLLNIGNAWINRRVFSLKKIYFEEELFSHEEVNFFKELKRQGMRISYNPEIFVYRQKHTRLEKLGGSLITAAKRKIPSIKLSELYKNLHHFIPIFFFISMFWLIFHPGPLIVYSMIFYLTIVSLLGIIKCKRLSPWFIFLHYFILMSYGIGAIQGVWLSMRYTFKLLKNRFLKKFIHQRI